MADHVDMADVDAELQRGRGDTVRICAGFEFLFDLKASLARKTAVMRADFALAQTLRQLVRHAFDQTARVDENQRRTVRVNLRHELIVYGGPDILADNRSQLFIGHLNMKLHGALVTDVDNGAVGRTAR